MPYLTLTKCSPLGDRDEKYGQRFWGEALEMQMPVSFNSLNHIGPGSKIEYQTQTPKTSKKGTEYMQVYKVQVVGHIEQPSTASAKDDEDRIGELLKLVREIHKEVCVTDDGLIDATAIDERGDDSGKDEVVLDDIDEEKVDLTSIPF